MSPENLRPVVLALVLATPTCEQHRDPPATTAEQCATLRQAISASDAPVKEAIDAGDRELRKAALAHEEAGVAVGQVAVEDEHLVDFRRRYTDNARDFATAKRDIAEAIEGADESGRAQAGSRLGSTQAAADNLAKELAAYCDQPR